MRKIYLVPNVVTAFGLACGLFVIFKANLSMEKGGEHYLLFTSTLLLLLAGFADLLDGAIARAVKAESEFGLIFDSLADAVSFGVAPSVLMLRSLQLEEKSALTFLCIAAAMIYSICAILRLVRFNVKSNEVRGNGYAELMFKRSFTGFPVPASAGVAVSTNLFLTAPLTMQYFAVSTQTRAIVLICEMVILGYFMISRWKFPTVKTVRVRVPSLPLIFLSIIFAIFILFGVLHFISIVFLIITVGYLLMGLTLSIIKKIIGKKTSTLDEFDEDDDK